MVMACGRSGSSSARSLSTLLRNAVAIRCSSSSGSSCSSDSSCTAAAISSAADVGSRQGNNSSVLRAGGTDTSAPALARLTGLGDALGSLFNSCKQEDWNLEDGDTAQTSFAHSSGNFQAFLDRPSASSRTDSRSTAVARPFFGQGAVRIEGSPLSSLSSERLPWARHLHRERDMYPKCQAQQLRPSTTSSFKSRPASPDLSLGTSSVDQDKLDPFALVADELATLGHKLRSMVAAEVPRLAEAAEYFFKLGVEGKRFRPMVLLLMASSLTLESDGKNSAAEYQRVKQQRIAEITEMIHVASLLHDDVLDHADTRRGIGSLNHVMGNKLAVLAGDFLLARASVALASLHNSEVVELLSKVLEHLVTGEIMQLTTETQEMCSMEYYMQKTFYKTASLMANSCKSIALLADQPREVADLAFEYGRHLGLAFQLVDDSLDFIGTKATLGKPTLSDLAQGIATAPVLFALEEHPRIYDLVNRKFRRSGDVDQASEMVRNSRGILRTQQLAAHHAHQAALSIAGLPPTSSERALLCRRALTELTEQVITRSK
ncbi:unnamed protein product [Calypogeia fissa]